jgi:hypothetical protein
LNPKPLSENTAVTAVGVATPPGPNGADLVADAVIDRLARRRGEPSSAVRDDLEVAQRPDPNLFGEPPIELKVNAGSDREGAELLRDWLAAIREARTAYIARLFREAREALRKEQRVERRRGAVDVAQETAELLPRLAAAEATVGVDYTVILRPEDVPTTTLRPPPLILGGLGGLVAGAALALLVWLIAGRPRGD